MLDHNVDPKLHPSIMSIGRKWVSDTNLSKLLHETIEKKQANKQSKLPDFCKDAILSATIKKISSALLINQNLSCSENDELDSLEDQNQCVSTNPNLSQNIPDEHWEDYSDIAMSLDSVELDDMDSSTIQGSVAKTSSRWHTARPPFERQSDCNSPKRKRQPSYEGTENDSSNFTNLETVAPAASPCKKRRADFLKSSQNHSNFVIGDDDDESWSEDDGEDTDSQHNAHGMHAQRSQSLPHLTFFSKDDLLSPSKNSSGSVVNSISELSINDCLGPSEHSSWCFSNDDPTDSDPLELNGFFQELNTVSVNPNS